MTAIPGTNVIAPIVPFDTADQYATHHALYGKGGYRSVGSMAERDAIPLVRREPGMLVYVTATGRIYRMEQDVTTWTALEQEITDGGSY